MLSELKRQTNEVAYWYACEALSAVTAAAAAMPSLACCTKLLSSAGVVTRLPAGHNDSILISKAWCAHQISSHLASLPSHCWRCAYTCSRLAGDRAYLERYLRWSLGQRGSWCSGHQCWSWSPLPWLPGSATQPGIVSALARSVWPLAAH